MEHPRVTSTVVSKSDEQSLGTSSLSSNMCVHVYVIMIGYFI